MGTAICKGCGAWVNEQAWRCRSCGRLWPGLFGQRAWLDLVFSKSRSQARVLLAALVVMYVFELLLSAATPDEGRRSSGFSPDPTGRGEVRAGALLPWNYEFSDLPGHTTRAEPWRIVSAMLLHGGVLHIVFNGMSLLTLGMYIEELFGPARFWVVFTLTGIVGNVAALWLSPVSVLVGASGGIFGLLGALLGFGIRRGGTWGAEIRRQTLRSLLINAVISMMPGISMMAHLGGAASGFLMVWLFKMPDGRGGRESDGSRFVALACMALLAGCAVTAMVAATHWTH
jgi:membrane associated rhomboid family serine protease